MDNEIAVKTASLFKNMMSMAVSDAAAKVFLENNVDFILRGCSDEDERVSSAALLLVKTVAAHPMSRQLLLARKALSELETVARDPMQPAHIQALAREGMAALRAGAAVSSRKEVRGVMINMGGLLGKTRDEDEYIKALLLVDSVTSVTLDRHKALAIVYTTDEREMSSELYDVVQRVCDKLRADSGRAPIKIVRALHAQYLEDESDGEGDGDEEADEDFFAEGSRQKIISHGFGAKPARISADDRLKSAAPAAGGAGAAAAGGSGIFGWATKVFGWGW